MIVSATHDARHAATAASAAVPPSARISAPASAVAGWPAATAGEITFVPLPNALSEPAAEPPETFEREVEPLAHAVSLRYLERATADRACCELAVLELHRQTVDRELD